MSSMQHKPDGNYEDEDYEIIIEEAGVGDPTVFASITFGGENVPSKNSPLENVKIKVAVSWPKIKQAIPIGHVFINTLSNAGPYRFGLPYDDATFNFQVKQGIALTMTLAVEAYQDDKPVKFTGAPSEEGYLYEKPDIIPKIYRDELPE